MTFRGDILNSARELTEGGRNASYGDPFTNMSLAGDLKRRFAQTLARPISSAEQEAVDMILTKISRLAFSSSKDTYTDIAAYAAIGAENYDVAQMQDQNAADPLRHQFKDIPPASPEKSRDLYSDALKNLENDLSKTVSGGFRKLPEEGTPLPGIALAPRTGATGAALGKRPVAPFNAEEA